MIDVRCLIRIFNEEKGEYYKEITITYTKDSYVVIADGVVLDNPIMEKCIGVYDDDKRLVYTLDIVEIDGIRRLVYDDGTVNLGGKCIPLEEVDCKTLKIIGNEREHFDLINGELL